MHFCKCAHHVHITGFHTGVENMGEGLMGGSSKFDGGWGLESIHGGGRAWGV